MDKLAGKQLIGKGGRVAVADELDGKVVLFYFSAHWCPPCRAFTPMLKQFYEDCKAQNLPVEIVFFSSDRSEGEMISYFENDHGDYLAVKYGEPIIGQVSQELGIRGIPSIVAVNKAGVSVIDPAQVRQAVQAGLIELVEDLRELCKDWRETGGRKLGGNSNSETSGTRKKSKEELRQARLEAIKKRKEAATTSKER